MDGFRARLSGRDSDWRRDPLASREAGPPGKQMLDRIREVLFAMWWSPRFHSQLVSLHQHVDVAVASGGFELAARELDLETVGVVQVPPFAEPGCSLQERRPRHVEGDVWTRGSGWVER
jgi:hypothetical protein